MSTVDELLGAGAGALERVEPAQAQAAMADCAVLVDIRAESQRERDGGRAWQRVHRAHVLEWRCDPSGSHKRRARRGP